MVLLLHTAPPVGTLIPTLLVYAHSVPQEEGFECIF